MKKLSLTIPVTQNIDDTITRLYPDYEFVSATLKRNSTYIVIIELKKQIKKLKN